MDLILVPAVLAAGAAVFTWLTDKRRQEAEERRAKAELDAQEKRAQCDRDIEQDRSRETVLQSYLDRMTDLIDGLRESEPDDAKRSIARARTLTVLRQLDGERKGLLLQFLNCSGLIGEAIEGEEKPKEGIVDLTRADLSEADSTGAWLHGADLSEANLQGANLCGANLCSAELRWANLSWAELTGAYLEGANLCRANLEGAYLEGADLKKAKVTDEQLAQAKSLEGTILPDGTEYAAKPEPAPAEPKPQDAEGQPNQQGNLDAGGGDDAP